MRALRGAAGTRLRDDIGKEIKEQPKDQKSVESKMAAVVVARVSDWTLLQPPPVHESSWISSFNGVIRLMPDSGTYGMATRRMVLRSGPTPHNADSAWPTRYAMD
jgi:hypothetical protein